MILKRPFGFDARIIAATKRDLGQEKHDIVSVLKATDGKKAVAAKVFGLERLRL